MGCLLGACEPVILCPSVLQALAKLTARPYDDALGLDAGDKAGRAGSGSNYSQGDVAIKKSVETLRELARVVAILDVITNVFNRHVLQHPQFERHSCQY